MTDWDVAIVGAGFTGAVFAIHLSRMADRPLNIALIDPNPKPGRGLAYGTSDPEHRLNAGLGFHLVYPDDLSHLANWCETSRILERDPEAQSADGQIFIRREDFGRYVGEQLEVHVRQNPSSSKIEHFTDRAIAIERGDQGFLLSLEAGEKLNARLAVVTTSFERPAIPPVFDGSLSGNPSFFPDPWDGESLASIEPDGSVLVIGMAQTASDVMASLLVRGHTGPIQAVSRRGLRPVTRPADAPPPPEPIIVRVNRDPSPFVARHGKLGSAFEVLKALRKDIREQESRGESWIPPYGDLRDSVWQIWPDLPLDQKAAFMRHLRPWYDVHRFRLPPQVEEKLFAAEAQGQLSFHAARLVSAAAKGDGIEVAMRGRDGTTRSEVFDAVINCTGPESNPARCANPFLRALVINEYASPHPLGLGFEVDPLGYARDAQGCTDKRLLIAGPLTYGAFGDQQGGIFIVARLHKTMPKIIENLTRTN